MKRIPSAIALLLLVPLAALARSAPPACQPCGTWHIDEAASEPVAPAVDAALAKYKPPRVKRFRGHYGDIASETEAEFNNSLEERFGPRDREKLRDELMRALATPAQFTLRQDATDVLIEPADGYRRRVTPGEPHARVDSVGTAEIAATLRGPTLTISEKYQRKTENREVYALDAGKGLLRVTRSIRRPGLPTVVVHSTYRMH
jgi:hypothetical protein